MQSICHLLGIEDFGNAVVINLCALPLECVEGIRVFIMDVSEPRDIAPFHNVLYMLVDSARFTEIPPRGHI